MTSSARPNLGGLFNGSTPPQRSSRIGGAMGPRLVTSVPISEVGRGPLPAGQSDGPPAGSSSAGQSATPQRPADAPTAAAPRVGSSAGLVQWADPVHLVNQYFSFLRHILDANQQWALACASLAREIPGRVGLHR